MIDEYGSPSRSELFDGLKSTIDASPRDLSRAFRAAVAVRMSHGFADRVLDQYEERLLIAGCEDPAEYRRLLGKYVERMLEIADGKAGMRVVDL